MSTDKMELARVALGEFMRTMRANEFFADDLEWDFSGFRGWIEDSAYHGAAGFDEQMRRWTEPFEEWTMQIDELIDLGGDDILALGWQRGTLSGSGAAVEMPLGQIWTVRDGKLGRIRIFANHEDARAAAGLGDG
jgi:ketosteroid isomerase-like protein